MLKAREWVSCGGRSGCRWVHLFLVLGVIVVFMTYLWWLRCFFNPVEFFWPLLLGLPLVNLFFGEGLHEVGLSPASIGRCFRERGEQLASLAILLIYLGVFVGHFGDFSHNGGFLFLVKYCVWGLLQQYFLNGFVVNRLISFWGDGNNKYVPFVAACVFGILHLPNLFLMIASGIGGYACVKIFLEYRNLYFLGLAHGLLGFLLFFASPEWMTGGFQIGIRFFIK